MSSVSEEIPMPLPDLERLGFVLTDEQRSIRDAMVRFAEDRLAPGAADRDKAHDFPSKLITELASLGGMAMKVSPADDGPGLDNKSYALAIEAIARSDA